MRCPYCNSCTKKVPGEVVYRHRGFRDVVICVRYPRCDAYVGTDKNTGKPLGILANKPLRQARKKAHAALDSLWISKAMSRNQVYTELSKLLELPKSKTHLAMFDESICRKVILLCENRMIGNTKRV